MADYIEEQGTIPGGYDTIFFTGVSPSKVISNILSVLVRRWPSMLMMVEPGSEELQNGCLPSADSFTLEWGGFYIARDAEMQEHSELTGGTLMPDGEGSIDIFYSIEKQLDFRITVESEVSKKDLFAARPPYVAWLCSDIIYSITVVTPENPNSDPFSGWMCGLVKAACLNQPLK